MSTTETKYVFLLSYLEEAIPGKYLATTGESISNYLLL